MRPGLYGLMAEFKTPAAVLRAAEAAYAAGYRRMDAFSPFPIEGLDEAIGFRRTRLPLLVAAGGVLGAIGGYGLQYWTSVIAYPLNIGGRPYHSWPAFIPVTFECAVLVAGLTAVLGMFALNRLPMPYHPVFNAPNFQFATRDRFFLCLEARDPRFNREEARRFLSELGSESVVEIED